MGSGSGSATRRAAALLLALASACATAGKERANVCREYRALRCATQLRCERDARRDCLVCACASWDAGARETGPAGAYPDGDPRAPALPPPR